MTDRGIPLHFPIFLKQVPAEALPATPSVNAEDDIVSAVQEWILEGTVDMHSFVKYLPQTARDLRQGHVCVRQVALEIMPLLEVANLEYERQKPASMQQESAPNTEDDRGVYISESMTQASLLLKPLHWERYLAKNNKLQNELVEAFYKLMAKHMPKNFHKMPREEFEQRLLEALYKCVQELFHTFAARYDEYYFQGQQGAFAIMCPVKRATLCEFANMMRLARQERAMTPKERHERILKSLQYQLNLTTKYVADGVYEIMTTCWECGSLEKSTHTLHKCGKCKVALYCGRDCQVKAWKAGHKKKCKELLQRHTVLVEALDIVDHCHYQGYCAGVPLAREIDYRVAESFAFIKPLIPNVELSMHAYYRNIGRVFTNDWWPVANPESFQVYLQKLCDVPSLRDNQDACFQVLCDLMCHDFFKSASTQHGITDPDDVTELFDEPVAQILASQNYGECAIPSDWFVIMYIKCPFDTILDTKTIRKRKEDLAYRRLKEQFHK